MARTTPVFFGSDACPACHAASIVEVASGELLATWFAGTHEGHPDVAIWSARYQDGRWSAPSVCADAMGTPLWNPVLFCDGGGVTWLFYKAGPDVPSWSGLSLRSSDGGVTWSMPAMLPAGLLGPAKNKPITLSNGNVLCPTSVETWRNWTGWVEISADGGATWERCGPILAPDFGAGDADAVVSATWDASTGQLQLPQHFSGVIQPTVWEYAPGCVRMLLRSTQRIGAVCMSDSFDYGRSWTQALATDLLNSNSGLDAVRLLDGRIALVCNPVVEGRTPLSILLSNDNGVTWPRRLDLETGAGEFSYPSIIQARDHLLHVVYTYRREQIRHAIVAADEIGLWREGFA